MAHNLSNIEFNKQFLKAFDLMQSTSNNVFVTGKAGTGKSTLLNHFRNNTSKQVAVLAPTGTASVNIKGQTVHSFFKFKPNVTLASIKVDKNYGDTKKENIYKKLDAIVIDEISMVRADLLDCIDKFLRSNGKRFDQPFGGVQMIFIGDLYQLPPCSTFIGKTDF
jgi:DNA replication protein DnaC